MGRGTSESAAGECGVKGRKRFLEKKRPFLQTVGCKNKRKFDFVGFIW